MSPTGSDSNPGSIDQPWQTVQKAFSTLEAGQIAYIRGGTYSQNLLLNRAGTASAPFTIRNYPGEQPILQPGTSETDNIPLKIGNRAAYVRLQGLVIEGATGPSTADVYAMGDAHDIELSACELRGSQRQGFYSDPSTSRIHVLGCNIHDNGGSGPTQLDHNVYMQGQQHVLANSRIVNAPNGFNVQIYPSSDRIIVTQNTIVGAFRDGIIVGSQGERATTNLTIVNNVIAFNGRYGISTYWGGVVGTGNVATRNLAWGNRSGQLDGTGIDYSENLIADPLFLDFLWGNFHVLLGSPAIDLGRIEYALREDLDGASRPQGLGPDLGAYER